MTDFLAAQQAFAKYRTKVERYKQLSEEKINQQQQEKKDLQLGAEMKLANSVEALELKLNQVTKKMHRPKLTSTQEQDYEQKLSCTSCSYKNCQIKQDPAVYKEYCTAFNSYLRWASDKHGEGLSELHRKSLNLGATVDGGYYLPDSMNLTINDAILALSPLRKYCSSVKINTSYFSFPEQETLTASWSGKVSRVAASLLVPSEARIEAHEQCTSPRVSQTSLQDSHFDIEGWVADKIADSFATSETSGFITGDGAAQPQGILSAPIGNTGQLNSQPHKYVRQIRENISDEAASAADVFYKVIYSMTADYRKDAVWLMNRKTAYTLRQLKDTNGNYLWSGGNSSPEGNFLGYPVLESDELADLNRNKVAIVFANLRRSYLIVDRDMHMLRDPYSNKPWVTFYVTRKVGGGVIDAQGITFLYTPASSSAQAVRGH